MTVEANEICQLSIAELGPLIRRRELSPVEIATAVLGRIDKLNGRLNAFCTLDPARVMEQAARAEREVLSGGPIGALCGIPIAIKDLIFTRDLVSTGGS